MTDSAAPADEPRAVRLMNTLRSERGTLRDDLATPQAAAEWLADVGLPVSGSPVDARPLVDLRTALRALAAHVTHDDRPAPGEQADVQDALTLVNRLTGARPHAHLVLDAGRIAQALPTPGPHLDDALTALAAEASALLTTPGADRLRACHGPRCVLFFVQDHPRREWCTPACGDRARAARYYRRRRAASAG